jgi:nicotinamidase/pyrazinamidase
MAKNALIMVDIQNDFCTGGSLEVPAGESIIPLVNQLQAHFDLIVATQDWHPKEHMSFASNHPHHQAGDRVIVEGIPQVLWPVHCVQNTKGAEFYPTLNTQKIAKIFQKGIDKNIDSYSAFFDNAHLRPTGLGDYLRDQNVKEVYIVGLATDYCVKYSALDAAQLKFQVNLIADACRGIDLKPGDVAQSLDEMRQAGVKIVHSQDLLGSVID